MPQYAHLIATKVRRLHVRAEILQPDDPVEKFAGYRGIIFSGSPSLSAHSEGLIDLLAQSETAEVAILFKEAGPDSTRVSVRTKPGGVDATVLTGAFGGGGHARAAGATVAAPLTEARRKELVKHVHGKTEDSRVSVRNVRRHVHDELRKMEKEGSCSQDDLKRYEDDLQKLTDRYVAAIDAEGKRKEAELLEI